MIGRNKEVCVMGLNGLQKLKQKWKNVRYFVYFIINIGDCIK